MLYVPDWMDAFSSQPSMRRRSTSSGQRLFAISLRLCRHASQRGLYRGLPDRERVGAILYPEVRPHPPVVEAGAAPAIGGRLVGRVSSMPARPSLAGDRALPARRSKVGRLRLGNAMEQAIHLRNVGCIRFGLNGGSSGLDRSFRLDVPNVSDGSML
jgi:hypothetical protein